LIKEILKIMKKAAFLILIFPCILGYAVSITAQTQSKTYSETRKLLLKMERAHYYKILKKLFEEGEARKADLIKSLYDSEHKVSLNAQAVLRYLANSKSLSALDEWYEYRKKNHKDYWTAPIELLTKAKYLNGNENDLTKLVLKDLYQNQKDCWANLIAFNKETETAFIEIIKGEIFTEGYHVVIRKENGK